MFDARDLRPTIVPKSDQLNAEQLLAGPMTIRVSGVTVTNSAEQPVTIHYDGDDGRPYKPCKTMRKVLILAWGHDGSAWAGKSMTLFNDPAVKFGGQSVGGIRISHVSHIERDIAVALTATKGKKTLHTIKALKVATQPNAKATAARYSSMIANDQAGVVARELAAMDDAMRDDIWQHFTEEQQGILTMEWPESV
jgi:hypothetical protein